MYIKGREKKTGNQRGYVHFYRNDSYFYIGNLSFLSGSRWNESLYFMFSVVVSNEVSSVETITKTMLFRLRFQSDFPMITRTDDRSALPVIKNGLLVVFL